MNQITNIEDIVGRTVVAADYNRYDTNPLLIVFDNGSFLAVNREIGDWDEDDYVSINQSVDPHEDYDPYYGSERLIQLGIRTQAEIDEREAKRMAQQDERQLKALEAQYEALKRKLGK